MKKKISKKEARIKYGIITRGVNGLYEYFLLPNGDVIDSEGDIRYQAEIKTKKVVKEIDYYGDKDNYIHLKFGEALKMYFFTHEFEKEYPEFTRAYKMYWVGNRNVFKNALQIISYVYNNKIPVHLYFNYTDKPVKNRKEAVDYFIRENDKTQIYPWELKD